MEKLDDISENVSVTSGLQKQLDRYDSDIDVKVEKVGYEVPKNVNMSRMKKMGVSSGSEVSVGSIGSVKKNVSKKGQEKASKIGGIKNPKIEKISSDVESVDENVMLNSDVSSVGVSEA